MRRLRALALRVAGLFGAGRPDADIRAELDAHVRMLEDEYVRAGRSADEARRAANAAFGSVPAAVETYRDRRGLPSVDHWMRDVRYAARSLWRSPVQTVSMILVLGLGIGASTVVIGMFDTAVWRVLPVPEPDRVVKLTLGLSGVVDRHVLGSASWFSYPELTEYRATASSLEAVAGVSQRPMTWSGPAARKRLPTALVTGDYFRAVRTGASLGRVLGPADSTQAVAVISRRLWRDAFEERVETLGQTIVLNRASYTIVGIAQDGFNGTDIEPVDVWLPLESAITVSGDAKWLSEQNISWLQLVGRLASNASIASASAEAAVIAARFDSGHPGRHTAIAITRASLLDAGFLQPGGRAQLLAAGAGITVAVGLLLLICGSNVAALLLARGAARQREIALRIALGAGRARIAQELIAEVLVIATGATAVGLMTHVLAARVLGAWLPPVHGLVTTAIDVRVLMLAMVSALGVALFFGLAPLRQALRVDCLDALKGQTIWLGARVSGLRARHALAGAQIAVSVVLLVATALLGRALDRVLSVDPGYSTANTYVVRMDPGGAGPRGNAGARDYRSVMELRDRLAREPGIEAVGLTNLPPFAGRGINSIRTGPAAPFESVQFAAVDGPFFRALGVTPIAGRLFGRGDRDVVIVNAALARKYWRSEAAALNQSVQFAGPNDGGPQTATVIGVVPDIQTTNVGVADGPAYYQPLPEPGAGDEPAMGLLPAIVVHASVGTPVPQMTSDLVGAIDAGSIATAVSIGELIGSRTGPARVGRTATGLVGAIALLVAAIGIHGLVAQAVARRTRDIGLYVALGASRAEVLRAVFGRTLRTVAIGGAAGLGFVAIVGAGFSRDLSAALFGLRPLDPWSFVGAAGILIAVTTAAAYVPARRALRVEPAVALRVDQ